MLDPRFPRVWFAALAAGALACGASSNGVASLDASERVDGAKPPPSGDGGIERDAGKSKPHETARGGDAGHGHDAGQPSDAGGPGDAHSKTPRMAGKLDASTTGPDGLPTGLHVVRGTGGSPGHIVDGNGDVIHLHGADRSGTEFACTYQSGGDASAGFPGFFDGPNDQAGVSAMASWHINAVRVPLNEDCWLGINGLPMNDSAANYQAAIVAWVKLLNQNGMVAVIDLHWAAPGTEATSSALGQLPMADADHAPAFWASVAGAFKDNSSVIFDLFNEPYITDWGCWLRGAAASAGCAVDKSNDGYAVAGMATLLQAVRNAGADNVVIMGGLGYSSDFSSWVSSVESLPTLAAPLDGLTTDNVAASLHTYDFGSDNSGCPSQYNGYGGTCNSAATTLSNMSADTVLSAGFPILMGECGISAFSTSTASDFSGAQIMDLETWFDGMLTYMERQDQDYIAWSWNTDTDPVLISDYAGTPTPDFGTTYQTHLSQF
jgi:hypothetical protein